MTYFDTIAVVSNCEKVKIFVLVLVELVFWSSNMTLLHKLEFNWSVKCSILCALDSVTQFRLFDQLKLNQFVPKLFWGMHRHCWSRPWQNLCKMTLGDTTIVVSPESNHDEFWHFDDGGPICCSCIVFLACNIKNKSFQLQSKSTLCVWTPRSGFFSDQMITNSYQTSYTGLTKCIDHVYKIKCPK